MAYNGYLIKVGTYTVPFRFIEAKKYKCGVKGQDLDSFTDANGVLNRNALANQVIKMEWETGSISEQDFRPFMDKIRAQYLNKIEKKASVEAFMPEIGKYVTMDCYLPDVEFTIDYADEEELSYSTVRLAFIGYGGKVYD